MSKQWNELEAVRLNLTGLAQALLEDLVICNLGLVRSLDLSSDSGKLLADRILGGGVQHLGLDLGRVGGPVRKSSKWIVLQPNVHLPHNKEDLVGVVVSGAELKIVDGVSAVVLRERGGELIPGISTFSDLVEDDLTNYRKDDGGCSDTNPQAHLLKIVTEAVHHIAELVSLLELVVLGNDLIINSHSGRLRD